MIKTPFIRIIFISLFFILSVPLFFTSNIFAQEILSPYINIVSPSDNMYVYGSVKLDAYIYGSDSDTVEWGVFKDTCHTGNLAAGNLLGKNDYFNYILQGDRHRFEIPLTVSDWEAGKYCFAIRQIYLGTPQPWYERGFNVIDIQISPSTQSVIVGETAYIKVSIVPVIVNLNLLIISTGVNNFTNINFSFNANGETDVPLISSNYGTDQIIGCADFNNNQECDWGGGDIWNSAYIRWIVNRNLIVTSPIENKLYFNDIPLVANYTGEENDTVLWSVKKNTCSGDIISDNSNNYRFTYSASDNLFSFNALLVYENLSPGLYCFSIDPRESSGNKNVFENLLFYVGLFDASVTLSEATVGSENTINVTINVPVSDIPVIINISGANPQNTVLLTNNEGNAHYSFNGINTGVDYITVCLDEEGSGICEEGEKKKYFQTDWHTEENESVSGHYSGSGELNLQNVNQKFKSFNRISHITYSGLFQSDLSTYSGNVNIIFHQDTGNVINHKQIKIKEFEDIKFREFSCGNNLKSAYFKAKADILNDIYYIEFFATDMGKDEKYDLVRILVKDQSNNIIYDTYHEGFEIFSPYETCTLNPSDQYKSISTIGNFKIE